MEVERARLILLSALMKEKAGDVEQAALMLQDVQVCQSSLLVVLFLVFLEQGFMWVFEHIWVLRVAYTFRWRRLELWSARRRQSTF